jgi:hypothetical protein
MINAKIVDALDIFGQERDKPGFGMCGATDLPISGNGNEADAYYEYPEPRRLKG